MSEAHDPANDQVSIPAGYARWASSYDPVDNPMTALLDGVLECSAPLDGFAALELGCGTGRNAATLLGQGARHHVGVDQSAEMLDLARAKFLHRDNVVFHQRDLTSQWGEGFDQFEIVLVALVLEHLRATRYAGESSAHESGEPGAS